MHQMAQSDSTTAENCGYSTQTERERCILVAADLPAGEWDVQESLDELERLAETAGATSVGRLVQKLLKPYPRTFLGSGKVEELYQMCQTLDASVLVFDDELTPSQQANLESLMKHKIRVFDRTALILDIFGQHARTYEGTLQVQLAQLQYLYPRLRGMWAHLAKDRTRGGIGSRFGQGESQLEVDRRMIRNRISLIRKELRQVEANRLIQAKERNSSEVYRIALAGYTNAGKSTLLNTLSDAGVYVQDQLFATLDPTTRAFELPGGRKCVLTDTVGFIHKLPTTLIASFKSTLAEVSSADLILEVADASDEGVERKFSAVDSILGQIGAQDVARLLVYNKIDMLDADQQAALKARHPQAVCISAQTGDGIEGLISTIAAIARARDTVVHAVIPYAEARLIKDCHEKGQVAAESYTSDGIDITVLASDMLARQLKPYAVDALPGTTGNEEC